MPIRQSEDGYIVDDQLFQEFSSVPGAVKALKKPIPIQACQMSKPFEVETTEGIMNGKSGDWLMLGVSGELYICPNDIFVKSYDIMK